MMYNAVAVAFTTKAARLGVPGDAMTGDVGKLICVPQVVAPTREFTSGRYAV